MKRVKDSPARLAATVRIVAGTEQRRREHKGRLFERLLGGAVKKERAGETLRAGGEPLDQGNGQDALQTGKRSASALHVSRKSLSTG